MNFCLPKEITDNFKKSLKDGELDIEYLASPDTTTEARRSALAKVVGEENATMVNTEFEKKLLLKNQQMGMIDFIKNAAGLKPITRKDLIGRVLRQEKLLSGAQQREFLNDVADQKFQTGVTSEQAKEIFNLAKKVQNLSQFNGIQKTSSLIEALDKLPERMVTPAQKKALAELKQQFQEIQQEKDEEKIGAEHNRQEMMKAQKEAKEALQLKAQRDRIDLQKKLVQQRADERAEERARRTLQRQVEKEQADLDKKQLKEQSDFDRESLKAEQSANKENVKKYLGKSLRKLKAAFGSDLPEDLQRQLDNLVETGKESETTDNLSGVSDEYLLAKSDLNNYINSITAKSSTIKNLSTIARNDLLANPATPIKTTVSQFSNTVLDAMTRRLASAASGKLPIVSSEVNAVANKYVAEAWHTFTKTGYNIGAMNSYDDGNSLGLGGKGIFKNENITDGSTNAMTRIGKIIQNTAKVSQKVVITALHSAPFNVAYHVTFADMARLRSTEIAKAEGLKGDARTARAVEIFTDAARIVPSTPEGAVVRAQAQEQAARITSTNDTVLSKLSVGFKNYLNDHVPYLGDIIVPIAKIPATLIANGIENAGGGIIMGAIDMHRGWAAMKADNVADVLKGSAQFQRGLQRIIRTIGVLAAAAFVVSQIPKKDFYTNTYDVSYLRIGDKWINLEYIPWAGPAIVGMMKAREASGGVLQTMYAYGSGVVSPVRDLPFVSELSSIGSEGVAKYGSDFVTSRVVPSILNSFEKTSIFPPSMTPQTRPLNRVFFGASGIETEEQKASETAAKNKAASVTRKATLAKKKGVSSQSQLLLP